MDLLLRKPSLLAAIRWILLLSDDPNLRRARALLRNRAEYVDLTLSQYSEALEWLQAIGAVTFPVDQPDGVVVAKEWLRADDTGVRQLVMERAVLEERPTWTEDGADLVLTPEDLPVDLLQLSGALGLGTADAFDVFHLATGRVELEARAAVGAAGERLILEMVRGYVEDGLLPTNTVIDWVSQRNDAAGYDIGVRCGDREWLLEVKATVRKARFRLFLSRNEFEVARLRPNRWHLLTVLLSRDLTTLLAIGSTTVTSLESWMPRDTIGLARWESARIDLPANAASPGIPIPLLTSESQSLIATGYAAAEPRPAWLRPVSGAGAIDLSLSSPQRSR